MLHKNVAFKTTVTYTKKVIETWKRLQLTCHRVLLNVSTTVIGAHHNGGLLFLHNHYQKVINFTSCGVAEEKDCDIQTESIATTELGGLSLIKNLIAGHGDEDNLGGMEYVMDESTRYQGMVFCSFFHMLNQQTYTAIIQCISILYSAPFDYTYTRNR